MAIQTLRLVGRHSISTIPATFNTANGGFALFNNMDGDRNTATGYAALSSQASGSANTATVMLRS